MTQNSTVERLRRQQGALAEFGTFAFRESDLEKILTEAARACASSLDVPFAKICRYRAMENDLLVVAGCGWHAEIVGYVVSPADESSTQGRAYVTGEPVILEDVSINKSFALPAFYAEHGIVSTADVLIKGNAGPWGVLEVDCAEKRLFDQNDIVFLTGFANIVAEAVTTSERTAAMQSAMENMRLAIDEKDELLSERESHEKRLHELQTELLHVSRLNAMGQMTAAIAHELNQPLAAIANYMNAAKRTLDTSAIDQKVAGRAQEMIASAQEQTHRAGDIIKNLRNIVEKRESRRTPQNLGNVVKESLSVVLFGAADAKIEVEMNIDPKIPDVLIDKIQIQQILVNLARNSMEAMSDTKECKLTVTACLGEPGFAKVTVQDTGPGLPKDVLDRLFQPFVTTKGSGMGLGLMICQTLAEANGGRIWYVEDLPVGTGFGFSVPFAVGTEKNSSLHLVA
ncbi:MAG: ATP-binding protein [Rhizomicrobium sp.]|jgi:signal transduction histidine kinase